MAEKQLVMIEWEDSRRPVPEWCWLPDYDKPSPVVCVSVGWLIKNGKKVKALAPNVGDMKAEPAQVSGVIQIPTRCIRQIVKLKVASVIFSSP